MSSSIFIKTSEAGDYDIGKVQSFTRVPEHGEMATYAQGVYLLNLDQLRKHLGFVSTLAFFLFLFLRGSDNMGRSWKPAQVANMGPTELVMTDLTFNVDVKVIEGKLPD
jgi:hypothetical protein